LGNGLSFLSRTAGQTKACFYNDLGGEQWQYADRGTSNRYALIVGQILLS